MGKDRYYQQKVEKKRANAHPEEAREPSRGDQVSGLRPPPSFNLRGPTIQMQEEKEKPASHGETGATVAGKTSAISTIVAGLKAAMAVKNIGGFPLVPSMIPQALDKIPLSPIAFAGTALSKALTTTNTTTAGKVADSLGTAYVDYRFSSGHPVLAAIDAGIGLHADGKRYNIGNTLSDSMGAITGGLEAIMTGDISGINSAHQQRTEGKNTHWFKDLAEFGDHMAYEGGGADRAQVSGDYYGGADSKWGRGAAFIASMPGIGHMGKKAGEWGARAVLATEEVADSALDFTGDALDFAGEKLEDFGNLFGEHKELKSVFKPIPSTRDTSGGEHSESPTPFINELLLDYETRNPSGGDSQPISQSGEIDVEKLKQAGRGSLKAAGKALDTVKKWSPF